MHKITWFYLRRNDTFERRQGHSVYYGTESLSFLSPKIWDLVTLELTKLESLEVFKFKIKKWIPFEFEKKLGFFEAVRLRIIIAIIIAIFIIYAVYTRIYIS